MRPVIGFCIFDVFTTCKKYTKVYTMLRSASLQDVLILGPRRHRVCVRLEAKCLSYGKALSIRTREHKLVMMMKRTSERK